MNIHDDGNQLEPIHRLLFNVDIKDILCEFDFFVSEMGMKFTFVDDGEYAETDKKSKLSKEGAQEIMFQSSIVNGTIHITGSPFVLACGTLASFLDNYLASRKETTVDYVHGSMAIDAKYKEPKHCAFILPKMEKSQLYETVIQNGVLPKKTLSMGHADDKRFDLEARRIK